jgi:hypothetical protein
VTTPELLQLVAAELGHIPYQPPEFQGLLRALYRQRRGADLSHHPRTPARATLAWCVATLLSDFPNARLRFDRAFFQGVPTRASHASHEPAPERAGDAPSGA